MGCAYPGCHCDIVTGEPETGNRFCSEACATAPADADKRCPCGHGDCRGLEEGEAVSSSRGDSSKHTGTEWKWNGALLGCLLLASSFAITGCSSHSQGAVVYVPNGPPVAVSEPVTRSPGHGYVWIPGYHAYRGNAYAWVYGHWEPAPRSNARWVPGHWTHNRQGWYWVDGRWR
jgi:hypothetical protein